MKMTKDAAIIVAKVHNTLIQVETKGASSRLLVGCLDLLDQMQVAEIIDEPLDDGSK